MGMRRTVRKVAQQYGVKNIHLFGSFARGEQTERSDIDLLVDPPRGMTLIDLSGLKIDLEDALKRKVDIVPTCSIKPALRNVILADARLL